MELTDEQKQQVTSWIQDGASLSDVQKRLREEMNISMTYMDVRFLVLDLNVEVKDNTPSRSTPDEPPVKADDSTALDPDDIAPPAGGVSLTVDTIMKPGSIVSGTVQFSDGKSGTWMLDQLGRLALDVGDPAYRPSPEDVQNLQTQLQEALAKRGF